MIIIPARMASNRFPNKILADINGLPMVVATANRVKKLDNVVVATDSKKVVKLVNKYGFDAILTGTHHKSGTDRINEASLSLNIDEDEVIVNVQADEPFIEPEVVKKVIDCVKNSNSFMVSCYKLIDKMSANDPNQVKVIIDINENAIYFSRSKIPYSQEEHVEYFGHLGIYGFTKKSLKEFCELSPAPLENIEKLEQLRAIYHNKKIAMVKVESKSFGIDTKKDLEKALEYFN
ncbi:MAG: 3-deoxy-manno-octulosonate cytidylyltransferase [Sulfurospirillum sp.]|nr:3-deoxy-manno-octulosonate cytidylyltransferase [Sulfurospirillum sp.]MBL0703437.1 3-deoxy-manno-octulosonate cytidylyltransferase [Sulfurospirillum sp.]